MAAISQPVRPGPELDYIIVECCRKCSYKYEFKLENGALVTIVCGQPDPAKGEYKALSYVWEHTTELRLQCSKCSENSTVPMRDAAKFRNIMSFVGSDSKVWIDALSINQSDPKDKDAQLPIMGDIYRHAKVVAVFLPKTDQGAYERIKELAAVSAEIVKWYGDYTAGEKTTPLLQLSHGFFEKMDAWKRSLNQWCYWQRAWTFQEWAMAREIDTSFEGALEGLCNIKNVIVEASTIIGLWKKEVVSPKPPGIAINSMANLSHRILQLDESSFELNAVRSLFPFETFLVADRLDVDMEDLRSSTFHTSLPFATDSGTYMDIENSVAGDKSPPLRRLLGLTLNAMGTSEREARYPADRIACWASACNIVYPYDMKETFEMALHKVIYSLREQGIRVYNFLANTDCAETDLGFFKYSAAHTQSNNRSSGYLFGTPIFIGRADTGKHLLELLRQTDTITHLPAKRHITLQPISKAIIKRPVPFTNNSRIRSTFQSIISGKADGVRLLDIMVDFDRALNSINIAQLKRRLLVTVSIGSDEFDKMWYFNAWAIIPFSLPLQDLFVARESLNGTFVLAIYMPPDRDLNVRPYSRDDPRQPATHAQVVAYLNMTHQRDGTYLVKSNEKGIVDIVFRTQDTPENELFWLPENTLAEMGGEGLIPNWIVTDSMSDRVLDLQISLEDRFIPLYEQRSSFML